ncbi:MAG: hypothetical protein Q9M10_00930, partial [Mariprofundaceae bacterium]|nr:hypothetical protein [Mariprofundaceae bacterium]
DNFIMDASDDFILDDISLSDVDTGHSDLLADASDVVSDENVTLSDEQLLTAFSDLDLGEFEHVEEAVSPELDNIEITPSVSVDTSSHEQDMNDLTTKMSALDDLDSGLQDDFKDVISPDLDDFDDLDIDLDAVDHDADLEEFTSTIQATLKELGVDDGELDEEIEYMDDIHTLDSDLDDLNLDDLEEGNLNTKSDFDASLELDSLLSELDNFSTKPNHE